MARRKKIQSKALTIFLSIIAGIFGLAVGFFAPFYVANGVLSQKLTTDELTQSDGGYYTKGDSEAQVGDIDLSDADVSIHFVELGNAYTGDCTLIKAGNTELLIDCGSKNTSVPAVKAYLDQFVTDGTIEYVIVTHAHQDHYAGFATSANEKSIFDYYAIGTIIQFAKTNQSATAKLYVNYQREVSEAVDRYQTKVYTAAECYDQTGDAKRVYNLSTTVNFEILYNYYYWNKSSSGENNHSVCCMVNSGTHKFLFTGDLEKEGEKLLAQEYEAQNGKCNVDVYKAGHHGSKTSSSEEMLSVFRPQRCCVCCCAGSAEYTPVRDNQFPTQAFINNIAKYTTEVYVTSLCTDWSKKEFTSFNGNIIVAIKPEGVVVSCSNNATKLKDSEWFNKVDSNNLPNRVWPTAT